MMHASLDTIRMSQINCVKPATILAILVILLLLKIVRLAIKPLIFDIRLEIAVFPKQVTLIISLLRLLHAMQFYKIVLSVQMSQLAQLVITIGLS